MMRYKEMKDDVMRDETNILRFGDTDIQRYGYSAR